MIDESRSSGVLLVLGSLAAAAAGGPSGGGNGTYACGAIQAEIARCVEATRTQDIDAYMAGMPADMAVTDGSGGAITRDDLRSQHAARLARPSAHHRHRGHHRLRPQHDSCVDSSSATARAYGR